LLRRLGIGSGAHELRLFGFYGENVAGVVLDELGVLVLKLVDLGLQFRDVGAEVFVLAR
jgi:hypothetical protein